MCVCENERKISRTQRLMCVARSQMTVIVHVCVCFLTLTMKEKCSYLFQKIHLCQSHTHTHYLPTFQILEPGTTKVVKRKKGVSVRCCANAIPSSVETPTFLQLPIGYKVASYGVQSCESGNGATKEEACKMPCKTSCQRAISRRSSEELNTSGFTIDASSTETATTKCIKQCIKECEKPGGASAFVSPNKF